MSGRLDSILETIGRTPVVRIKKLAPANVNVFAKLEAFNPMGSVKDRLALGVIEAAERSGALKRGQTVVEATSGNTGIGLAMVCAEKGYPLVVTMSESFSVERRKLMRFLGARVVLTPASEKGSGMLAKAVELAERHGWFLCRQFENEANADVHSRTTAREILDDFSDIQLDYWVTGVGTGGTLKGVASVLKQERPGIRIAVTEPDNSPILGSGLRQKRSVGGAPDGSHPHFRPHLMQGWTPDFISRLAEDSLDGGLVDEVIPVKGAESLRLSRELARSEGIFAGISAGATLAGALDIAKRAAPGTNILCMLPDTGERYLSTPLFENIATDMTAEETEISRSTPRFRFDTKTVAAPPTEQPETAARAQEAQQFVASVLNDRGSPVVMFALEWCEFCWSARKLFKAYDIPYRSIDLDAAEYQKGDWGGEIRKVVRAITRAPTIPQIFVGGEHIGGCTETFDAFNSGWLKRLLGVHGIVLSDRGSVDAYAFLPQWLHPRSPSG
jgi:cysteine synthase A